MKPEDLQKLAEIADFLWANGHKDMASTLHDIRRRYEAPGWFSDEDILNKLLASVPSAKSGETQ